MCNHEDVEKDILKFIALLTLFYVIGTINSVGISLTISDYHTNDYSVVSGLGLIYFFVIKNKFSIVYSRNEADKYFYFFLFFFILGTSAASYFSMFIALLVYILINYFRLNVIFIGFMLFMISFPLIFIDTDSILQALFPNKSLEEIYNLRGRAELWDIYIDMFNSSPVFGNGYAISSRLASLYGGRDATNTHNGFFEAFLGAGVFGGILLISFFISLFKYSSLNKRKSNIILICSISFIVVNNNSKSIIGGAVDPTTIAALLLLSFFALSSLKSIR